MTADKSAVTGAPDSWGGCRVTASFWVLLEGCRAAWHRLIRRGSFIIRTAQWDFCRPKRKVGGEVRIFGIIMQKFYMFDF